jgi:hypothetical protein
MRTKRLPTLSKPGRRRRAGTPETPVSSGKTGKAIKTFTFVRTQVIAFLIFGRTLCFSGVIARDGQMANSRAH